MNVTQKETADILLEWSNRFIQLSLRDFSRYTHEADLSMGQMTVLMYLHYHGACEVSRFCGMMHITPAGASQMIARMVRLGVVQRTAVPADRRVRMVELTPEGRQVVAESILARQAWVEQLAAQFTAEERNQIHDALRILNERADSSSVRALNNSGA